MDTIGAGVGASVGAVVMGTGVSVVLDAAVDSGFVLLAAVPSVVAAVGGGVVGGEV